MGTLHIELWISWRMILHKIGRLCNQWCTGLDQYFFPSCILLNYHHSEVMDFHHRHKSGSGNHYNHLDSWYYRDNLEKRRFNDKNTSKLKPCTQSVRALPHSMRQLVSEHDKVQSMYWNSHCSSHFAPISSSLKTNNCKFDNTVMRWPNIRLTGIFWGQPRPGNLRKSRQKAKLIFYFS